jgi:hypothetical protein
MEIFARKKDIVVYITIATWKRLLRMAKLGRILELSRGDASVGTLREAPRPFAPGGPWRDPEVDADRGSGGDEIVQASGDAQMEAVWNAATDGRNVGARQSDL